jgi:hypothetical protein
MEHQANRRDLLLTSLMAALPLGMTGAVASPLNPEQTIIKPPDELQWKTLPPFPPGSVDTCALTGEADSREVDDGAVCVKLSGCAPLCPLLVVSFC